MNSAATANITACVARFAKQVTSELHGVVVSAGLMDKTVKVRVGGQKWNKTLQKTFADPKQYLVHDPNSSLRTGDVVVISSGWRTSRRKRHVVKQIITPSGIPINERPPIPTQDERISSWKEKRINKYERQAAAAAAAAAKRAHSQPATKATSKSESQTTTPKQQS